MEASALKWPGKPGGSGFNSLFAHPNTIRDLGARARPQAASWPRTMAAKTSRPINWLDLNLARQSFVQIEAGHLPGEVRGDPGQRRVERPR